MTVSYTVTPSTSAITVNTGSNLVSIHSTDINDGIDSSGGTTSTPKSYTVTIFLVTEGGTD